MIFDKENHTYTEKGKVLQPVSDWLNQFVPPFLSDKISGFVARKQGVEQEEILKMWEAKRNISLHLGNWVHESIECYLKYDKDFTNEAVEAFKKEMSENKYHSEIIVHDDELAGTIDLIEIVNKGKVAIHDFKTTGDLYKKHGKLLEPYKALDNSPINKYRLQLSKYQDLLEGMKNVEVVGLYLWHYKDGEFNKIEIEKI